MIKIYLTLLPQLIDYKSAGQPDDRYTVLKDMLREIFRVSLAATFSALATCMT